MNAIGRSINSFNCLVSVVGLGFLSAVFVKLDAIKGYEGALLEWFQLKLFEDSFPYSNQIGTTPRGWVKFTSTSSNIIAPFAKKKMREKFRWRLSLGSSCQTSSTSWRVRMKKCTSSAHTLWSIEYGVPFNFIDITEIRWVGCPIKYPQDYNPRHVIWKLKFLSTAKSDYPYVVNIDTANQGKPVDGKIIIVTCVQRSLSSRTKRSTMPKNLFKWERTSPVTLVQPT